MIQEKFLKTKNKINYLRISVTDKCNFRCIYCMPKKGVFLKDHSDIISIENWKKLIEASVKIGINKVRITGGEPLLKKNIINLVEQIKSIKGIKEISMTTNGIYLSDFAKKLKKAGLDRINISLDTLNEKRFKKITRVGNLKEVLKGIDSAIKAGLNPIKINIVIIKNFNTDEIFDFIDFFKNKNIQIRFIELMQLGETTKNMHKKLYFSINDVKAIINKKYILKKTKIVPKNGPSENYIVNENFLIGFISAVSKPFCLSCNRIRITSDGKVRICLHKNIEYDILDLLIKNKNIDVIANFLKKIIFLKFKKNLINKNKSSKKKMFQIGG